MAKTLNILIKIFPLLPLSLHVYRERDRRTDRQTERDREREIKNNATIFTPIDFPHNALSNHPKNKYH